jgi:hypothetical protein
MGKRLRYSDLVARGIVRNRTTLKNWQKKYRFPLGQRTGNTRTWDEDTEIDPWLESQPTEPKPAPAVKGRIGRPRKADRLQPSETET